MRHEIFVEEFGGDVPCVHISALKVKSKPFFCAKCEFSLQLDCTKGTGVTELEETIVTLAEVLDFKAEQTGASEGTVIESRMEKGKGSVCIYASSSF
jgi:translation initiation factor IF-2